MTSLRGTGTLLRAALRRDRISSSLWVLLLASMPAGTAARYAKLFPTDAARRAFAHSVADNHALSAFGGAIASPTLGGLMAFKVGSSMFNLVALMAVLIVVRHTRAEEDTGRAELVAACVVGRSAALTAALLAACAASLAVGLLTAAGLLACGLPRAGALAFAAAAVAPGIVFAAVAGLAAQVASNARGATMLASGALGASYAVRFAADGSRFAGLRWLSPEGWSHEVGAFGANRVGALAVSLAFAAVVGGAAYLVAHRRDLGSGLLTTGRGPASAPRRWGLFALAWRLQRGLFAGWAAGLAVLGALCGAIAPGIPALTHTQGSTVTEFFHRYGGTATSLTDTFLWLVALSIGYTAALYPALAILRLRSEETLGTAELLLSAPVSRTRWIASHVLVAMAGSAALMAASGVAMAAVDSAISLGSATQFARVFGAVLVQTPAVVVLGGVAMLAVGFVPRAATGIVWAAYLLLNVFGEVLGPAVGLDFSIADQAIPFHHLPRVLSGAPMHWFPVLGLVAVTASMLLAGSWALRRRDLR